MQAEVDEYGLDFDFYQKSTSAGIKQMRRCLAFLYLLKKYHAITTKRPVFGNCRTQDNESSDEEMRCSPDPLPVHGEVCDSNALAFFRLGPNALLISGPLQESLCCTA
jgi:hypothetical protein